MSKVYVVQRQLRRDESGRMVFAHDFTPAENFGRIVVLLDHSASPYATKSVCTVLHNALCEFSDDDYLLLVGAPSLIGAAMSIAADYNDGRVKVLNWSKAENTYVPAFWNLFEE